MPMYALASIPIIKKLGVLKNSIIQAWYADDASAAGRLCAIRDW